MSDKREQNIDGNNINNKRIPTPRSHHVEISQRRSHRPENTSSITSFKENIE